MLVAVALIESVSKTSTFTKYDRDNKRLYDKFLINLAVNRY